MSTHINTLQKKIMRRIYYAYGIRLATHTVTMHMLLLVIAGYLFARLVHVSAVFQNFSKVQIGEVGSYALQVLANADLATLAVIGIVCATLLSLRIRLHMPQLRHQTQTA